MNLDELDLTETDFKLEHRVYNNSGRPIPSAFRWECILFMHDTTRAMAQRFFLGLGATVDDAVGRAFASRDAAMRTGVDSPAPAI